MYLFAFSLRMYMNINKYTYMHICRYFLCEYVNGIRVYVCIRVYICAHICAHGAHVKSIYKKTREGGRER